MPDITPPNSPTVSHTSNIVDDVFADDLLHVSCELLAMFVRSDPQAARKLFSGQLLWLEFLPEDEQGLCVDELVAALTSDPDSFVETFESWRASARVWQDPELAASLTTPVSLQDFIEVAGF